MQNIADSTSFKIQVLTTNVEIGWKRLRFALTRDWVDVLMEGNWLAGRQCFVLRCHCKRGAVREGLKELQGPRH